MQKRRLPAWRRHAFELPPLLRWEHPRLICKATWVDVHVGQLAHMVQASQLVRRQVDNNLWQ